MVRWGRRRWENERGGGHREQQRRATVEEKEQGVPGCACGPAAGRGAPHTRISDVEIFDDFNSPPRHRYSGVVFQLGSMYPGAVRVYVPRR